MDIDKFYHYMRQALRRLYGYYVKRPAQRYNIENRAEKLIERKIPRVAPRHEGTQEIYEQIIAEHPEIRKQLTERSDDLLNRLKAVKVVSRDRPTDEEELRAINEAKERLQQKLPQLRIKSENPWLAFAEPLHVPKYKISLPKAVELISSHAKKPDEFTAEAMAEKYNLKLEDVQNILKYYKAFVLFKPTPGARESSGDHIFLSPGSNLRILFNKDIYKRTKQKSEESEEQSEEKTRETDETSNKDKTKER